MSKGGSTARRRFTPKTLVICSLGAFCFFSTFSIAGTQTALVLAVVLWAALVVFRRIDPPRPTALDLPVALFVAVSLAAALLSTRRMASLVNLKNLLLISIVYLFGWLLETKREGRSYFAVFCASGAASSLYGIVIFFLKRGEGTLGRTPGSFSTAMTYGGVLLFVCSLLLAAGIARDISSRIRIAVLSCSILSAAALFFSFTRSSWLGMLASAAVIVSMLRRRWLIPLAVLLVIFLLVMPAPYRSRITSLWDPAHHSNIQRLEMLRGGWGIFRDHPWVGVGTMDLADTYRRYMPPEAVFVHGHMHNIFLQVAVTMGVIGLAAFCYLLFSFYRLLIGNLRRPLDLPEHAWVVGSIGALTGFIVNGLFEWNFGDAEVVMLFYMVIGVNLAFSMRERAFGDTAGSAGME
jgi:putative inorganic carbon (HCO3(-)) transporter